MGEFGRVVMVFGLVLLLVGGGMLLLDRVGLLRLPGDIVVRGERSTLYFPLSTSIVLSIVLTLVLNLILRARQG